MKNVYILLLALGTIATFTACKDNGSSGPLSGNGGSGGTNNFAPKSLQDRTLTAQVNSGSGFFTNTGNFVISPIGSTSGTFSSTGIGGASSTSTGNFSYVPTPGNEATLVLDDPLEGTVTMNLLFQTSVIGTYSSTAAQGGTQTGTFLLQ
ncbi:MAG: hypothetical protein JWM16_4833 [Verrucomicrobiales bacterium]|nr:hypothetical protein [Verrucomicrobiales bacterium]